MSKTKAGEESKLEKSKSTTLGNHILSKFGPWSKFGEMISLVPHLSRIGKISPFEDF